MKQVNILLTFALFITGSLCNYLTYSVSNSNDCSNPFNIVVDNTDICYPASNGTYSKASCSSSSFSTAINCNSDCSTCHGAILSDQSLGCDGTGYDISCDTTLKTPSFDYVGFSYFVAADCSGEAYEIEYYALDKCGADFTNTKYFCDNTTLTISTCTDSACTQNCQNNTYTAYSCGTSSMITCGKGTGSDGSAASYLSLSPLIQCLICFAIAILYF